MLNLALQSYLDHYLSPKLGTVEGPESTVYNILDLKSTDEGGITLS